MASPDDTTQHTPSQGTSERPSAEEPGSSATPYYNHPFPFTIVPNVFIDVFVPHLSPTAQSVMLVLYRLTLGWHRADTFTSLNELRQRTGIASHATLNAALKELLAAGLITVSQQRGLRGLKGYCLTSAARSATETVELPQAQKQHNVKNLHLSADQPASSSTESVALNQAQPPHNVQKLHTTLDDHASSATDSVEVPLQKLTPYLYRNRRSTSTESVEVISSQPAQGPVPDKPKERRKKQKETNKEIDRYERSQNETQNEVEEHTNTRSPAAFLTKLLEQHATPHGSGTAASPQREKQLDAQHAPVSHQPSSRLEAYPSTPTTLLVQQPSVPKVETERMSPPQRHQRPQVNEDAADLAARRQRLLARQRNLRMEKAIKHLIASLAESA